MYLPRCVVLKSCFCWNWNQWSDIPASSRGAGSVPTAAAHLVGFGFGKDTAQWCKGTVKLPLTMSAASPILWRCVSVATGIFFFSPQFQSSGCGCVGAGCAEPERGRLGVRTPAPQRLLAELSARACRGVAEVRRSKDDLPAGIPS